MEPPEPQNSKPQNPKSHNPYTPNSLNPRNHSVEVRRLWLGRGAPEGSPEPLQSGSRRGYRAYTGFKIELVISRISGFRDLGIEGFRV